MHTLVVEPVLQLPTLSIILDMVLKLVVRYNARGSHSLLAPPEVQSLHSIGFVPTQGHHNRLPCACDVAKFRTSPHCYPSSVSFWRRYTIRVPRTDAASHQYRYALYKPRIPAFGRPRYGACATMLRPVIAGRCNRCLVNQLVRESTAAIRESIAEPRVL